MSVRPLELLEGRGPIVMPARPSFESIVAQALEAVPGHDALLLGAMQTIADGAGGDDDGFGGELAAVTADGADAPGDGLPLAIGDHTDTGDALDTVRQSVNDLLPSPEGPIEIDFEEPVPPPDLRKRNYDKKLPPDDGEVLQE